MSWLKHMATVPMDLVSPVEVWLGVEALGFTDTQSKALLYTTAVTLWEADPQHRLAVPRHPELISPDAPSTSTFRLMRDRCLELGIWERTGHTLKQGTPILRWNMRRLHELRPHFAKWQANPDHGHAPMRNPLLTNVGASGLAYLNECQRETYQTLKARNLLSINQ